MMGRKSKLKQERRASATPDIIDIKANDNNWLYIHGKPLDLDAKIAWHGKLDECIERAILDIPALAAESSIREVCSEYGLFEGQGWCLIYKSLHDRGRKRKTANKVNDVEKLKSAIERYLRPQA